MFNRKKLLFAAMATIFSSGAYADSTAEQIKTINENVAVLSAKLAEMEVQAKIAGKKQEIGRLDASAAGLSSDSNLKELPVVRSIEGADGRMQATLATGGRVTQTVVKGDKIGDWTVYKIDVNSVTLARGKQIVRLAFGTEPPTTSQAPQGGVLSAGYPPVGMQ